MDGYQFDTAVLGGGPGGYEAAIRSAQYGLKTALIEARELGGTCLNRGCIPMKALLQSAHVFEELKNADRFGITAGSVAFDYQKMSARKDGIVKRLRGGIERLEKAHGVTVMRGFGKLLDAHTIEVNGDPITAEHIILATGSRPSKPPIPGADGKNIVTSDEVLAFTSAPKDLIIIGGGVIGMEFASLFSALGRGVTVLELMPHILPDMEAAISRELTALLEKKGVKVITGAKVLSLDGREDCAIAEFERGGSRQKLSAECCILSVGRRPMTSGIGLEETGVRLAGGYVAVDEQMRTSVEHIFAVGDITGKLQLAHVAAAQGLTAAANCAGHGERMDYAAIPACVYTEPEIACIGLTEEKARERGHIRTGVSRVAGNGRAQTAGAPEGFMKLVSDAETGEVYGAQIFAPNATELIAGIAVLMKCEGTVQELSHTVHPHPTLSELILEAAHDTEGLSCHAMPHQ